MVPVPEHAASKRPGLAPRSSAVCIALFLPAAVCACLAVSGCARHVSLSELGASDAIVWVLLTTTEGERIVGQVVSLDAGSMVVEVRHELGGDVSVRTPTLPPSMAVGQLLQTVLSRGFQPVGVAQSLAFKKLLIKQARLVAHA